MNASDLFVEALENEGVEFIFGIPGEENLVFLESLRRSNIKLILTRHEQAAGFMAAAYGRLTGKTGVCLSTLGPGATNFSTSASYALLGGMPVLFLTGQKPIKKSKQGQFQIIDVVASMRPITKFAHQIVDGNTIPHLVRECFRLSEREKPGPTHLELPEDIADDPVDRSPFEVTKVSPPATSQAAILKATEMINAAQRPLILFASGANRDSTHKVLLKFLDKTGLFFFTTQMGKGAVDERHERCLGTAALSAKDYIHSAIEKSDLIINVGHDVSEKPPFIMYEGSDQKVIHVAFSEAQMDDVYFPNHELIGCMNANISMLTDAVEKSVNWDFQIFESLKQKIRENVFNNNDDPRFPYIAQRLVSEVRQVMPSDGILSLDNGMYKIWFARNYLAHQTNTVLLDNALATMGAGLPVAIGAKLVYPGRKVLAICGDGGFMMNSQELETAVRLNLDLVVLILRDDAYGMIKWKQAGMGYAHWGLDFGNPDFVKYAEAYGAKGHRVTEVGGLANQLKASFAQGGVHLIETPIDYSENPGGEL